MTASIPTGAENVRWNLSLLYSSIEDPQIDADLAAWAESAKKFNATYKGRLHEVLGAAIRDYADLGMLNAKPAVYMSMLLSLNTGDAAVKTKAAQMEMMTSQVAADTLEFFSHELVALEEHSINEQAKTDETVAKHLSWIHQARLFKQHMLPEPIEAALTKRGPFGTGAWSEFFDEFEADLRFPWEGEDKSLTEMLHVMNEHPNGDMRAAAMKAVNEGFAGTFAKFSAQTLYMVAGANEVENRERGYEHPMHARNKSSQLPDEVVDALHAAVISKGAPVAKRFYKLKAKILGRETLRWSDRNAPMPFADTSLTSWDKAMDIVLTAYRSFSPTLADLIEKTVANGWIDAPATKGKRGGAFNMSWSLPGAKPVSLTFLNYLGAGRDVMTVAHELGHGVHGLLAGEAQGPLMSHAPIALCETASVFGEMTTFNSLLGALKTEDEAGKKAKLALIMDKLDDMTNTVVRQISFSNFERRLHGWNDAEQKWGPVAKRSADELDALWRLSTEEMYGADGEVFTYENIDHLWSYISHFHRCFYVYGYAFGELLTQSLYAARPRLGDKFEPLYLDMLRAGGTKDAKELLAPFDLDPTDPKFWEDGLEVSMGKMVAEAEALAAELKLA